MSTTFLLHFKQTQKRYYTFNNVVDILYSIVRLPTTLQYIHFKVERRGKHCLYILEIKTYLKITMLHYHLVLGKTLIIDFRNKKLI